MRPFGEVARDRAMALRLLESRFTMRKTTQSLFSFLGLMVLPAFAIVAVPKTAPAQPAAAAPAAGGALAACNGLPPKPEGHVLGRIESIDRNGNAKIAVSSTLQGRDKPKNGDDIHLLSCDGVLVKDGRADVDNVRSDNGVSTTFKSLKNPERYVNQYVAIDNGYATATPIGPAEVEITNIESDGFSGVRLVIGAGEEDGVFPGSEGRLITKAGQSMAIKVNSSSRQASQLVVPRITTDAIRGARVLIQLKAPRCFPPKPIDPNDFGLVATRTTPPAGYIFAKGMVAGGVLTADKGSDDRVTAGEAYILTSTLIPVKTETINAKTTTMKAAAGGNFLSSARVILPILPVTSPGTNLRCTK